MKKDIIKSESDLPRDQRIAFALSFFFTGLGQIYNGDFSKGIVFLALRILSLLIIPISGALKSIDSFISFFVIAFVFHAIFWILSPIEAMFGARGKDSVNLKRYNSLFFYSIYGTLSTGLLIFSFIFVTLFISIERIDTNRMNPTFLEDEYILVNRYAHKDLDVGDVVIYSNNGTNSIGRIIAKENETFRQEGNAYYINDTPLQLGIVAEPESDELGLENSENLFVEVNGRRRYPVIVNMPESPTDRDQGKTVFVLPGMLMLSIDNRMKDDPYHTIESKQISGNVEGVLYSSKFSRLLTQPYLMD